MADELLKAGINIERKRIELADHALKALGQYTAKVRLYEDEVAVLKFSIVDAKGSEEKPAAAAETTDVAEADETGAETAEEQPTAATEDIAEEPIVKDGE